MSAVSDFIDIFGKTKAEISEEMGYAKEYVSGCLRGRNGRKAAEQLAEKLKELADQKYQTEMDIAAYRRKQADKIISKLTA